MNNKIQLIAGCLFSIACWFFGTAYAQSPSGVKTDDVLKWSVIQLAAVGQDVVEGPKQAESASIKIDDGTGERIYSYGKTSLRVSKSFAILQRNAQVIAQDESFDALPKNLTVGERWKHTTYTSNNLNNCGRIKFDYEAVVNQGPEVIVIVKGFPVTFKTIEIIHEGPWFGPTCGGSGKSYRKYVFSPELNEIVLSEVRYFYKGYITNGRKIVLESIN